MFSLSKNCLTVDPAIFLSTLIFPSNTQAEYFATTFLSLIQTLQFPIPILFLVKIIVVESKQFGICVPSRDFPIMIGFDWTQIVLTTLSTRLTLLKFSDPQNTLIDELYAALNGQSLLLFFGSEVTNVWVGKLLALEFT